MSEQFHNLEQTNDGRVCKRTDQHMCLARLGRGEQ